MDPSAPLPHAKPTEQKEITIVSHSNLFYWWPVWAVGFLMALLTYFDNTRLLVVPKDALAERNATVTFDEKDGKKTLEGREVLIMPQEKSEAHLPTVDRHDPKSALKTPAHYVHISRSKNYGVLFGTVLLLVIVITNVPLRGMWSLVVIITLVMLIIILVLAGWWESIVTTLDLLDIRINAGGYLFISGTLFVIWLVTMLMFDRQIYIVFTPGQFKVCTEIGGGEKVYGTVNLKLERERSDLFRHYILGLGSGDLIVKTTGAQADHFDLPNVLFINKKVKQIEQMIRTQPD
jgi:hypothetical protein